ncbi:penicillin-binding transpeptidase domain-containing protein [Saccharopolyspora griseoalba]|uniref:Penicillin-binding transpeptidase domain-containing protein n=1 Tax=Saccharopolyspora griseoalba TaxID=1431848 RepID=A0ABW2LE35_9PSEU
MVSKRILVGLAAALLVPVAGCSTGPSEQEVAAEGFLKAYAAGNAQAAAGRTDSPKQATQLIESVRGDLRPTVTHASLGEVTDTDSGARATYNMSWDFGEGKVWRYQGSFQMVEDDQGWKVRWAPSVIHPKLKKDQSLAYSEVLPDAAPVTGSGGNQLMSPEKLTTVTLSPQSAGDVAGVAGQLAAALGQIEPSITQQSIMADAEKGQPFPIVTLRQSDFDQVRSQISDLPGVTFPSRADLVSVERGYASQVLAGVGEQVDKKVSANAGWKVAVEDSSGQEVTELSKVDAKPVQPTEVTISDSVQRAAEKAVDPFPQAAMVVAIKPSTGELLAVAQNDPADKQGPVALTGQYPPGSTFKVVTASAALEKGNVKINTPVECPGKKQFAGDYVLPNDKEFDLGRVPLITAFAHSCNTTFAQLAVDMPADALPEAAKKLGVGVDFQMPGATTITGKVGTGDSTNRRAQNGIGQGTVTASPFGMALAAASVANGGMPTPNLIKGERTEADSTPQPPSRAALDQLRTMMREVVKSGTATNIGGSGEVYGKTGTAQFGDGTHSHGWFVGYRGDLAFATLITDAGKSVPAVDLSKRFLDGL